MSGGKKIKKLKKKDCKIDRRLGAPVAVILALYQALSSKDRAEL